MHIHRKLAVWRKAHDLTVRLYGTTASFPLPTHAALVSQMRRAAASIGANIAEGSGRVSPAQFAHFLQLAIGSSLELDYYLLLARDLALLSTSDHATLEARTDEVCKMLVALRRTVAQRALRPQRARSPRRSKQEPLA